MDERVAYTIQGSDKIIYFAPDGVTFALTERPQTTDESQRPPVGRPLTLGRQPLHKMNDDWKRRSEIKNPKPTVGPSSWTLSAQNPNVRPIGQDKTEAIISYFKGPQDQWHAGLPTYASIIYPDLWPGIDLVYYGTVNQLKYEFIVHPGADPNQIRLAYDLGSPADRGGTDVSLNTAGQMQVTTPLGSFTDDTPVAYQEMDGQRVPVSMAYQTSKVSETFEVSLIPHSGFVLYL